jgi:uncharacterized protein YlzI (FlbEa/FlbD family)
MAVRIRLSNGSAFIVTSSFDELHEAVQQAIREGLPLLDIRNGNGEMRSINPLQIASLEETADDALTPAEEEALQAVEERKAQLG